MDRAQIVKALSGTTSIVYRGWLQYLLGHIENYGECPKINHIGKSYEHNSLWDGEQIYGHNTILPDDGVVAYTKDGKAFEIRNGELYQADCTAAEYLKYQQPMPYMVYSTG